MPWHWLALSARPGLQLAVAGVWLVWYAAGLWAAYCSKWWPTHWYAMVGAGVMGVGVPVLLGLQASGQLAQRVAISATLANGRVAVRLADGSIHQFASLEIESRRVRAGFLLLGICFPGEWVLELRPAGQHTPLSVLLTPRLRGWQVLSEALLALGPEA